MKVCARVDTSCRTESEERLQSPPQPRSIANIAFPNDENAVALPFESADLFNIASLIASELPRPVPGIRFRRRCEAAACVRVPKATMDKNCPFVSFICEVRLARKIIDVIAEALAEPMHGCPRQHFRPRILRADTRHHLRARERFALPARWNLSKGRWLRFRHSAFLPLRSLEGHPLQRHRSTHPHAAGHRALSWPRQFSTAFLLNG